ncbi:Ataxin 3 variant ref [Fasciola hepatica]|uniref:Ataxin-3 homolog n=1 Tax=Fasciola hepatica TaxID=6192 RepID=A0A4E0R089_FASHE|nr:Ataxin 3 variant ref [Fasciola hepatica]
MERIFHEKQEGSLCAQHCLNALLQGPFFTAVDLAELAKQLDEAEQSHLPNSSRRSQNMDETGYFSIQVITKALSIWSLELVPLLRQSPEAETARKNPTNQKAFICNFRDHWFTIRRLGQQWFDLNSIMSRPKLISNTYLEIYLAQLQKEGHSIFFVTGKLPTSEADRYLWENPLSEQEVSGTVDQPGPSSSDYEDDDEQMKLALALCQSEMDEEDVSLQHALQATQEEEQERELQRALELSVKDYHCFQPSSDLK